MDDTIETATRAQRVALRDLILGNLQEYNIRVMCSMGRNHISLTACIADEGYTQQWLPDVDIVLERFLNTVKLEPDGADMAACHLCKKVVKHIKGMPEPRDSNGWGGYTNLRRGPSR